MKVTFYLAKNDEKCFEWMFTWKDRRRYSRERASQIVEVIFFIYSFASFVLTFSQTSMHTRYTIPLEKRLQADGRGLQDATINDKSAQGGASCCALPRFTSHWEQVHAETSNNPFFTEVWEKRSCICSLLSEKEFGQLFTSTSCVFLFRRMIYLLKICANS